MNKKNLVWHPEKRLVKDLKTWSANPRKISKEAFEKLKERIRERGFHDVIKIDTDDTVLSGNQRKKALLELGIKEVTALVPSRKLREEERNKIALESNTNDGEWDFEALKSFDLGVLADIGFDTADLAKFWDKDLEVEEDEFDEEVEVKKAQKTDIQLGNMFALGSHRLICGDSQNTSVVNQLMGSARANMVNDDLPFNIGLSYDRGVGNKKNKYGGSTNDSKSDEEYRNFVKTIMQNAISVSKPNCHYFFWCDERWVWLLQTLYRELGIDSKRLLIWIKNNSSPTPTVAFNKATEFCVYGTRGSAPINDEVSNLNEIVNKKVGAGNEAFDQILDLLNIWMVKRLPSKNYKHPTQKSPTLHEKALRRCTRPGDVVLDLTAGSGSILSACEQLKRVAYMCEIEPIFCQVIINRFEKLTGLKAKLIN